MAASIGRLSGAAADSLRGRWAVTMATAVWMGERAGSLHEAVDVPSSNVNYKAALSIALKNLWLRKRDDGRGYQRGSTPPPGLDLAKLPPEPEAQPKATKRPAPKADRKAERVEQLGKLLAERGTVTRHEAAEAIGIASDSGSWPRILKQAEAEGLASPGFGYIDPGPKLPDAPKRDGVRVGRTGFVPTKVVEQVTRLRTDGLTLKAVVECLNSEDVPTASGYGNWHPGTIRELEKATAAAA